MTIEQRVALAPYVSRFSGVLSLFVIGIGSIIHVFQIDNNTGMAVGVLMASAVSAGQKFLLDHKRAFSGAEILRMSVYSLIALLTMALTAAVFVLVLNMLGILSDMLVSPVVLIIPPLELFGIFVLASLVLLAILYLTYGFLMSWIYKAMVKRGEI